MRTLLAPALALLIGGSWSAGAAAQQRQSHAMPPLAIDSLTGRDSFTFYCASCHGRDGKGNGPTAVALNRAPADLTTLRRRAGGVFPRSEVEAFVMGDGRPVSAHGTGDMPVWGPIFRSLDTSDIHVKIRLANLVEYLESIQTR